MCQEGTGGRYLPGIFNSLVIDTTPRSKFLPGWVGLYNILKTNLAWAYKECCAGETVLLGRNGHSRGDGAGGSADLYLQVFFANYYGVNTSTTADFKLPTKRHWTHLGWDVYVWVSWADLHWHQHTTVWSSCSECQKRREWRTRWVGKYHPRGRQAEGTQEGGNTCSISRRLQQPGGYSKVKAPKVNWGQMRIKNHRNKSRRQKENSCTRKETLGEH